MPPTKIFLTLEILLSFGVNIAHTASIPSWASIPASSIKKFFFSLYSIATPPPVTETVLIPFLPLVGMPLVPLLDYITL